MTSWKNLGRVGGGTYGDVYKAQDKKTLEIMAVKIFKEDDKYARLEIRIHRQLSHVSLAPRTEREPR